MSEPLLQQNEIANPEDVPNMGEVPNYNNVVNNSNKLTANNMVAEPEFNQNVYTNNNTPGKKKNNNNANQTVNNDKDKESKYTNADLIKVLKLSKLLSQNEGQSQPLMPTTQGQPQIFMIPQQPQIPQIPQIQTQMYPPPQMPFQQLQPQSMLTYTDREEIRNMISRYSEDTEKMLKEYIKDSNEKVVKYVKELFAYNQNMNTMMNKIDKEEETEKTAAESNSASPIVNAINSIPKQIGNVYNSIKGAVGSVVNSTNKTFGPGAAAESTGTTPPTGTTTNTKQENKTNEEQIDNSLKTSPPPPSPPDFIPPEYNSAKNQTLAENQVNRLKSDLGRVNQAGGARNGRKNRKTTHKKNRNTKQNNLRSKRRV
jgi:hypothetical protein